MYHMLGASGMRLGVRMSGTMGDGDVVWRHRCSEAKWLWCCEKCGEEAGVVGVVDGLHRQPHPHLCCGCPPR